MQPILLRADDPWGSARSTMRTVRAGHDIMPYKDMGDAIALANRGMGSLVLSLFTYSPDAAREFVQGAAAFHGRMLVINRDNAGNRPATDRPCRCSSTAAPAAPADRGDGRDPRRQALHAAHRDPVDPGDDRRDHRAIYSGRAQHILDVHPFRLRMSELHIGDTWRPPAAP